MRFHLLIFILCAVFTVQAQYDGGPDPDSTSKRSVGEWLKHSFRRHAAPEISNEAASNSASTPQDPLFYSSSTNAGETLRRGGNYASTLSNGPPHGQHSVTAGPSSYPRYNYPLEPYDDGAKSVCSSVSTLSQLSQCESIPVHSFPGSDTEDPPPKPNSEGVLTLEDAKHKLGELKKLLSNEDYRNILHFGNTVQYISEYYDDLKSTTDGRIVYISEVVDNPPGLQHMIHFLLRALDVSSKGAANQKECIKLLEELKNDIPNWNIPNR